MPDQSFAKRLVATVRTQLRNHTLPTAAKQERRRDKLGLPADDPGIEPVVEAALDWLCLAQDRSKSQDGGVALDYSLIDGWATSYPETTGYIIPTFLSCAGDGDARDLRGRARRMLDWLARIQFPSGAFQGGKIDSTPVAPVTFNTGQILLGLAAGEATFGSYGRELRAAADWLTSTQDPDGCWRKHPTPFAAGGEKAYETHVAWGLLEAERVCPDRGYAAAALKNIRWALTKQNENGWLKDCCLTDPTRPLTHTLGYALRGVLEGYRFNKDPELAAAARRTADALLNVQRTDGSVPGRLRSDWSAAVSSTCLTGNAQIAHCWLMLYEYTGERRYFDAGRRANAFVRRTVHLDGPPETRGAVKGSFPVDGDYAAFTFLNWAPKFLIDSSLLEQRLASVHSR